MTRQLLIIDDDEDVRDTLRSLLEDEDYEVHAFADGVSALAALADSGFTPGAVLLDQSMPMMSGEEVRRALQADARWSRIPILFCSGSDVSEAARAGVLAVLEKPFDLDRLLQVLNQVFA